MYHKLAWLSSRKNALYFGVAIKRAQTVIRPTRPPLPKSCLRLRGRCCGKPDCRWVPGQGNTLLSHPDLIKFCLKPIKWKCLLFAPTRHALLASFDMMMLSHGFIQGNLDVLILSLNQAASTCSCCFSWRTWSAALIMYQQGSGWKVGLVWGNSFLTFPHSPPPSVWDPEVSF